MKNIFCYYVTILAPIGWILWLVKTRPIDASIILGIILFYLLAFRTYIDGKRLVEKKVIAKKDIWKMIIPGKHFEYFKELYLK